MEKIISNLNDLTWWFDIIFAIAIGWSLKLAPKIFRWLPVISKKIIRKRRLKEVTFIRHHKRDAVYVNWEIARYWAIAVLASLYLFLSGSIYIYSPDLVDGQLANKLTLLALFFPSYVLMFFVIKIKDRTKKIMREHIKWKKRITKQSTRC